MWPSGRGPLTLDDELVEQRVEVLTDEDLDSARGVLGRQPRSLDSLLPRRGSDRLRSEKLVLGLASRGFGDLLAARRGSLQRDEVVRRAACRLDRDTLLVLDLGALLETSLAREKLVELDGRGRESAMRPRLRPDASRAGARRPRRTTPRRRAVQGSRGTATAMGAHAEPGVGLR